MYKKKQASEEKSFLRKKMESFIKLSCNGIKKAKAITSDFLAREYLTKTAAALLT